MQGGHREALIDELGGVADPRRRPTRAARADRVPARLPRRSSPACTTAPTASSCSGATEAILRREAPSRASLRATPAALSTGEPARGYGPRAGDRRPSDEAQAARRRLRVPRAARRLREPSELERRVRDAFWRDDDDFAASSSTMLLGGARQAEARRAATRRCGRQLGDGAGRRACCASCSTSPERAARGSRRRPRSPTPSTSPSRARPPGLRSWPSVDDEGSSSRGAYRLLLGRDGPTTPERARGHARAARSSASRADRPRRASRRPRRSAAASTPSSSTRRSRADPGALNADPRAARSLDRLRAPDVHARAGRRALRDPAAGAAAAPNSSADAASSAAAVHALAERMRPHSQSAQSMRARSSEARDSRSALDERHRRICGRATTHGDRAAMGSRPLARASATASPSSGAHGTYLGDGRILDQHDLGRKLLRRRTTSASRPSWSRTVSTRRRSAATCSGPSSRARPSSTSAPTSACSRC